MRKRHETFGGIVAGDDPPFLAFVDRDTMRQLGAGESPLWDTACTDIDLLSAPTEVHISVTNRCSVGCDHCYMGAGEPDPHEMDTDTFKKALAELAHMGVFHIAMGGGEALLREDLFVLARHARELGLIPNLTISGVGLTPEKLKQMTVFGQVNVSLDGIGPLYQVCRGRDLWDQAHTALERLIQSGIPGGINCVLSQANYSGLKDLFAYAKEVGANEIEFLRFKPSGRGRAHYEQNRLTHEQHIELVPCLTALSQTYGIVAKIDCSFVPMLCYHTPPRELLDKLCTYGCEAGNVLVGVRSNGIVSGCSFLEPTDLSVFDLAQQWQGSAALTACRRFSAHIAEPCASCAYLSVCKGGCHAVSAFVTGDVTAPDPECPWVVEG